MNLWRSPKLAVYGVVAAAALVAALALQRPAAVAVGAPFLAVLYVGLATARGGEARCRTGLDHDRVVEGQTVALRVCVESPVELWPARIRLMLPRQLQAVGGPERTIHVPAATPTEISIPIRPNRFGGFRLEQLRLEATTGFGLLGASATIALDHPLRVFPAEETLARLLRPRDPDLLAGDDVSTRSGDGIEFADARPYLSGDPPRRIDWRLSSRRQELWIRERREERDAQVVLFLDSFDALGPDDSGTLELEVRAAAALAAHHLRRHDRVGMIGFGGVLRWLTPGGGTLHGYRLLETLLDTSVSVSYAWKNLTVIPPRVLPPHALVVALSPLLDNRVATALIDLRLRGFDLAVIEIAVDRFLPRTSRDEGRLAHRLLTLELQNLRGRLRELGAVVEEWEPSEPLAAVLARLEAARRGGGREAYR